LRGVDLFSGAGGLTLGFKRAGIHPIVSIDKSRDALDTYKVHTPEPEHLCADIRDVDLSPYERATSIVYGGPPCQPFSTGGLRRGRKDSRDMLPAFLDAVRVLHPAVVFMENVPGLAVKSRIGYLHNLVNELERLGYRTSWSVLSAADYGVPQKRRRLFVVGARAFRFWFPRPSHGAMADRAHVPAGDIISEEPLGEPPTSPVVFARYPDIRPSPYAGHLYNGGGRPINMAEPCHTILASAGGYKTHWVDTEGVAVRYHSHLMAGGEPWEGQVPGARRITVEESALLQTFPSDLVFAGSRSSQYTQVGDAVPPLLAEVLGRSLVRQFEGASVSPETHLAPVATNGSLW